MDDPAFLPDLELPPLDFDVSLLGRQGSQEQYSNLSIVSYRSSSAPSPGIDLAIPSSGSRGTGYRLPSIDPFETPGQKLPALGGLFEEEEQGFDEDVGFEFDADGNVIDVGAEERERRRTQTGARQGRIESDPAASGRTQQERDEARAVQAQHGNVEDDGGFNFMGDDDLALPEAEAFPPMAPGAPAGQPGQHLGSSPSAFLSSEHDPSSVSAEAPARRRARVVKSIAADPRTELRNADLKEWQQNYLVNMAATIKEKHTRHLNLQAKKAAEALVWGNGLGGIGQGIGSGIAPFPFPLAMYSGENLRNLITGVPAAVVATAAKHTPEDAESPRRVRPRLSPEEEPQLGRGVEEDEFAPPVFDDSEIGREAPPALPDMPSAASMPWNSGSVRDRGLFPGSSARPSSQRPGSRMTQPSPLLGRGTALGREVPDIERLSSQEPQNLMSDGMYPQGDAPSSSQARHSNGSASQFELFGPAATVDTQTAGDSQWMREALDRESLNFLDYLRKARDEGLADGEGLVGFSALFVPENNSRVVASQAFLHVLGLATKGLIAAKQDAWELYDQVGEIWMGIIERGEEEDAGDLEMEDEGEEEVGEEEGAVEEGAVEDNEEHDEEEEILGAQDDNDDNDIDMVSDD